MGLSKGERETIVRWSDDKEELATIFTHSEKVKGSLLRAGAALIRASRVDGEEVAWTLSFPREWARLPRKRRQKVLTEEQRCAAAQRLAAGRKNRKSVQTAPSRSSASRD
jgi:hypothetical protein